MQRRCTRQVIHLTGREDRSQGLLCAYAIMSIKSGTINQPENMDDALQTTLFVDGHNNVENSTETSLKLYYTL